MLSQYNVLSSACYDPDDDDDAAEAGDDDTDYIQKPIDYSNFI